jgi:hypothetical protein
MSFIENLIHEFQHESAITRRVLERVPADNLTWKPHAKSMSIGELALHIPHELKILAPTVLAGGYDFGTHVGVRQPASADEANLERDVQGSAVLLDSGGGVCPHGAPEPHVPSSGAAVGLPAAARRAGAVDLRPERG